MGAPEKAVEQEAVLVYLRGRGLPDAVYKEFDIVTLEDQLEEAIAKNRVGEFDGNEFGPNETVLYMYGPDAERLFEVVQPILKAYPLCHGARVLVRAGGPQVSGREIRLPR